MATHYFSAAFSLRHENVERVSGAFRFGRRTPQSTSWAPEEPEKKNVQSLVQIGGFAIRFDAKDHRNRVPFFF